MNKVSLVLCIGTMSDTEQRRFVLHGTPQVPVYGREHYFTGSVLGLRPAQARRKVSKSNEHTYIADYSATAGLATPHPLRRPQSRSQSCHAYSFLVGCHAAASPATFGRLFFGGYGWRLQ